MKKTNFYNRVKSNFTVYKTQLHKVRVDTLTCRQPIIFNDYLRIRFIETLILCVDKKTMVSVLDKNLAPMITF